MSELDEAELAALVERMRGDADAAPDPWLRLWGAETCRWLAAVPRWTVDLAVRAGLPLPPSVESVQELVAAATMAGAVRCSADTTATGAITELFWVEDFTREAWLAESSPGEDPLAQVRAIARAVRATGEPPPPTTRAWLSLLDRADLPEATVVVDDVRQLVAQDRLSEASSVVDAGAALAPVVRAGYGEGIARARRLVQRGHRDRRDRSLLSRFVRQPDQIDPLWQVLTSTPPEPWAIHLIGPGGVGKTTLLRHLAAGDLGAERDRPGIPVARVDFDLISPDYPVTRPMELLRLLADDLASWADSATREAALNRFRAAADSADAAAPGGVERPEDLARAATARFGAFVALLPPPQVLVLDTCEELAKFYPAGAEAPAVERTFGLLDEIHAACRTMRVVLAGRRYLASAGSGWSVPASVGIRSVVSLARRPELRLAELRGFDRETAVDVLREPHPRDGTVPSDPVVEAILRRSPEVGGLGQEPDRDRFNPFLIGLYREWWEDDPDLSAATIHAAGPEAYVEIRIVGRLRDTDIEGLLPALAVLGRLDEDTLVECLPAARRGARDLVIAELAEQEWISVSIDMDTSLRVIGVTPGMLPLLQQWADRRRRSATESARADLVTSLMRRLRDTYPDALTPELVAAALRLADEADAVAAWGEVEETVATDGRWSWAESVLSRVRGELEAWNVLADRPVLDAALTFTALAARGRSAPESVTTQQWQRIVDLVSVDGDDARAAVATPLRLRAAAAVASGGETVGALRFLLAEIARPDSGPPAAYIGAAEAVLAPVPIARRKVLGADLEPEVDAAAAVLRRRLADHDPALLAGALTCLSTLCTGRRRTLMLDWAATSQLWNRRTWAERPRHDDRDPEVWVALHVAAAALRDEEPVAVERLTAWRDLARGARGTEADRLLSCCVELCAFTSTSPQFTRTLLDRASVEHYDPAAARPDDAVLDEVRPLFVAAARTHFRMAEPLEARRLLEVWRQAALHTRQDDTTVLDADLALLWLAAKMRWTGFEPSLVARALGSGSAELAATARALRLLTGAGGSVDDEQHLDLEQDLRIAVLLSSDPGREQLDGALGRAIDIRHRDPVTACQLATDVAIARRNGPDRAKDDETVEVVRGLYDDIAPDGALPGWGRIGADIHADDPWAAWRARWALLDGSGPVAGRRDSESRADRRHGGPAPAAHGSARPSGGRSARLVHVAAAFVVVAAAAALIVFGRWGPGLAVVAVGLAGIVLANLTALMPDSVAAWVRSRSYALLQVGEDGVVVNFRATSRRLRWAFGGITGSLHTATVSGGWHLPMEGWAVAGSIAGVIELPAGLQDVDWEGRLIDPASPRAPDCVLVRDVVRSALDPAARGVRLTVSRAWEGRLDQAYGQPVTDGGWAKIAHLVGEPVETSVGPILHVDQDYWSPTTSATPAWLTVLQQPPGDSAEQAQDPVAGRVMRTLALDVALDGCGWVLVLPAVPAPVAEHIWRRLATLANGGRPTRLDLAALARDIKRTISRECADGSALSVGVLMFGPWTCAD